MRALQLVFLWGLLAASHAAAQSPRYTFRSLLEITNTSEWDSLTGVAINNQGTVAALAVKGAENLVYAVASDGRLTLIANIRSFNQGVMPQDINEAGAVVFGASSGLERPRMQIGSGGALTTIGPYDDETPASLLQRAQLNNAGAVSYFAGDVNLFFWEKGARRAIGNDGIGGAALNNAGAVAHYCRAAREQLTSICLDRNGTVQALLGASDIKPLPNLISPSLTDSGEVTYIGRFLPSQPDRLVPPRFMRYSNGQTRMLFEILAPSTVIDTFRANAAGTVAFVMANPERVGIYVGPDPVRDKVVEVGDTLFGGRLASFRVLSWARFLNDRGQILFNYNIGTTRRGIAIATPVETGASGMAPLAIANGASFDASGPVAQDSIVTLKGTGLALSSLSSPDSPPPTALAGTTVAVRDALGAERLAPLFYVSPSQINLLLPPETAQGMATFTVNSRESVVATGNARVAAISPGLIALNAGGPVAANVLRVRNGVQTYEPVYRVEGTSVLALPIEFGAAADQVYLLLYGTGFRRARSVAVTVGGVSVPVLFAGASTEFHGLDQANIGPLPRSLAGRGAVNVALTADGLPANGTTISFR